MSGYFIMMILLKQIEEQNCGDLIFFHSVELQDLWCCISVEWSSMLELLVPDRPSVVRQKVSICCNMYVFDHRGLI